MTVLDIFTMLLTLPLLPFRLIWSLFNQDMKYSHVENLDDTVGKFTNDFNKSLETKDDQARRSQYTKTTSTFYNLITDFYEYGWGQSFHFAPRYHGETFAEAIRRYEHFFAANLGLDLSPIQTINPTQRVLDVGCGVGGPMRAIAKFLKYRARITGINITREHIKRAQMFNTKEGIEHCDFICGDFNKIPVLNDSFDAAYDMEATLHSTDLKTTFSEIYRVLKPGAKFVSAQYCLLDAYDGSKEHKDLIRVIDNTNGCYVSGRTVASTKAVFEEVGFKIISNENVFDKSAHSDYSFTSNFDVAEGGKFTGTKPGMLLTLAFCHIGEGLGLLPKGTIEVQQMLISAADSFKEADKLNLITPGQLFILQKPLQDELVGR
ncbi:hypothetical protein SARC_08028 [Sphaeroforma arctica JP610]|uniref:Methyltransferase n=1 Tax=Sphaeroforma arctica JP610 TaxID=667725 RepID=A0A0L0FS68_9EUKA|nr:hypothetical protein SARC_08028 [Sphaeroforma arctica JP610]KNC79580.1 hypothetical protein SARC_08028 [Sphaeroforma arctica JP610]|eukprot:XP_014153482.1 hypothetical protein SARC_08028 [Sphaeroforma arctica JP610]